MPPPVSQVIQGTLKPDGTLELSERPAVAPGPVEIVLRALPQAKTDHEDWWAYMQRTRKELEASGYPFMNDDEARAYLEELRAGDDRLEEIYRQADAEKQA